MEPNRIHKVCSKDKNLKTEFNLFCRLKTFQKFILSPHKHIISVFIQTIYLLSLEVLMLYFETLGNLPDGIKMLCKSYKIIFSPLRFASCIPICCLYQWILLFFKNNHIHRAYQWCFKDNSISHRSLMEQVGICCQKVGSWKKKSAG